MLNIKKALNTVINNSLYFMYIEIARWSLTFLSLFLSLLIISIIKFIFLELDIINNSFDIFNYILLAIGALIWVYISASLKGAMIKKYDNLLSKGKIRLKNYIRNAIDMGCGYFGIEIIKLLLFILTISIVLGILYYTKKLELMFVVIGGLLILPILLIIDFITQILLLIYATQRQGLRTAIKTVTMKIKRKFKDMLLFYILLKIIQTTFLIPFFNIISILILEPMAYVVGIWIVKS